MSNWVEIGKLDDIPRLGSRVVASGDEEIAIFRTSDDELFALRNKCPHKGGPLSEGIVHGKKVTCPLHNWNVDIDCGAVVAPDEGCVPTYEVKVEAGVISLNTVANKNC
ncbi:nitrite reductase [Solemya pervernicosa gill symbiont]|uniref:Nitrite reductase n=2 Tax=Gammaproteobacteria incertae sedis TaxID=118884 RepID=A0A1T2L3B2_9GAMM|nr:nitrite reductase small subunit NirD [Candidatus Reidiella endopervernicosa]OOZ39597.1 nitrite reductase [Solemya pervernicosa gill symbiont]QKQ27846.1 nitrite reductase small subunit NirD [Candidatus Reidiella endopervernicosa]